MTSPTLSTKVRASCDHCHTRKIKCSGHKPSCSRCVELSLLCTYSPPLKYGRPSNAERQRRQEMAMRANRRGSYPEDASAPGSTAGSDEDIYSYPLQPGLSGSNSGRYGSEERGQRRASVPSAMDGFMPSGSAMADWSDGSYHNHAHSIDSEFAGFMSLPGHHSAPVLSNSSAGLDTSSSAMMGSGHISCPTPMLRSPPSGFQSSSSFAPSDSSGAFCNCLEAFSAFQPLPEIDGSPEALLRNLDQARRLVSSHLACRNCHAKLGAVQCTVNAFQLVERMLSCLHGIGGKLLHNSLPTVSVRVGHYDCPTDLSSRDGVIVRYLLKSALDDLDKSLRMARVGLSMQGEVASSARKMDYILSILHRTREEISSYLQ